MWQLPQVPVFLLLGASPLWGHTVAYAPLTYLYADPHRTRPGLTLSFSIHIVYPVLPSVVILQLYLGKTASSWCIDSFSFSHWVRQCTERLGYTGFLSNAEMTQQDL